MGRLINIDNGGTLTDFCVFDNGKVFHTKTLTTPFDLSKCFFEGLKKIAETIYGNEHSLAKLLQTTDYIRYSTTQGTNALVERKGPRLGLITANNTDIEKLAANENETSLLNDLIGDRIAAIDVSLKDKDLEMAVMQAVNHVATAGANRIVLSQDVQNFVEQDKIVKSIIGRKFPSHLLGVVPVIPASELADDKDFKRRTWSAIMNAFLHPAMERFLYNAEHRLKDYKTQNPLLIFRNDGGAARIAKTIAIKTYSSGPCGGLQGAKVLAEHYQLEHLVTYDVGGTTTDIGEIKAFNLDKSFNGLVEGVPVSFPLPTVHSAGVGGSSIIAVKEGKITVGPQSVGSAPGPACFSLGGQDATITDVFLLLGILNPDSYFGGELNLSQEKARQVITKNILEPLGLTEFEGLQKMRDAWVSKIADSIREEVDINDNTTLAGFGGAGALAATRIADELGVKRIIIPGLSAVFSAFGIGFSPISQSYRVRVSTYDQESFNDLINTTLARAAKDLFAEGIDIKDCIIDSALVVIDNDEENYFAINEERQIPCDLKDANEVYLVVNVGKTIGNASLSPYQETTREAHREAVSSEQRDLLVAENDQRPVSVIKLKDQEPGHYAEGPIVIEESYFTGFIDESWSVVITHNNDLLIEKIQ